MKMSKSLASYIGIKVAQLKVMCGLSVDLEAIEDKAVNSVSPDPIAANKFQSVYRQRLRNKQLDLEFKAIGKSCEDHSTNAALRNVLLNVKQDVVTYDHSRVIVWDIPVTVGTDYYNASFVDGYNGPKEYIAVQGPSSKCLASFWHLVWQERVTCIVMATGLFENAVQQCDKYWVDHTRKYSRHGDIHIWHERSIYLAKLNIRTFRIQKNGSCESRLLTHFEMVGFHEEDPDPGLVLEVRRRVNALAATQPGPVLVHCRCGGGRTAVYISVDFCLHQLHAEDRVDIYNTVLHLRRFRKGMVRTLSQYTQIYKAVAMYLQCGVTVHPALTLPATVHVHYHLGGESKHLKLDKEFHTLQSIVPRLSIGDCASGHRVENRSKSRDIMMLPPECARPYLTTADCGDSGTDFINAVYVDGYHFENEFLVTQWPLRRTIADLWRLLFDFKITSLVVMHNIHKFSRKYPRFWPKEIDQVVSYGPISVRYLYCERKPNLTVRTFTIRKVMNTLVGCETHMDEIVVKLFQVLGQPDETNGGDYQDDPRLQKKYIKLREGERERRGWSESEDHEDFMRRQQIRSSAQGQKVGRGLNQWSESLKCCLNQVSEWQRRAGSRQPVCVVSKDGSSRVGAYCAIAVACDQARVEKEVDVFNAVRLVRKNRPQLVRNIEEYQFIYRFMADYITVSNSKPEIVISEPEVTPECFSASLSLSPVAPVIRSHFGGISVAAPGKVFNPEAFSGCDNLQDSYPSPRLTSDAIPTNIQRQSGSYRNGDPEGKSGFKESETNLQEENSCRRDPACGPSQCCSVEPMSSCAKQSCDNLKGSSCKELENVVVDHQHHKSGNEWNEFIQHNISDCKKHLINSVEYVGTKHLVPINDNQGFATLDNNAISKSSNLANPKIHCTSCVDTIVCNTYYENSCSCVDNAVTNQSFLDHYDCKSTNGNCSTKPEPCQGQEHQYLYISSSQSHISPHPNPLPGSPWFYHARSKPNTPQRKVSWPPPAALSPGQYICPQKALQTPTSAISTVDYRFFPPPVPPPTPCLRLSQLSTCTSSTSFYSCQSQLSVSTKSPSYHDMKFCILKEPHHFACCKNGLYFPNPSQTATPQDPPNQTPNSCKHLSNILRNDHSCSSHISSNGCPQFLLLPSTVHHLDVPKNSSPETKATFNYLNSLKHPKSVFTGDSSANNSTRSTHIADNLPAVRPQVMSVCVPSGGGNPTDFKLIHASYVSLDESVCSSIDGHARLRSETNGNIPGHCEGRQNMISSSSNNYCGKHLKTAADKKLSSSGLTIRRLSKRCSAEEILLDKRKSDEESPSRSKNVLQEKSTQSNNSFWKRIFRKSVRK